MIIQKVLELKKMRKCFVLFAGLLTVMHFTGCAHLSENNNADLPSPESSKILEERIDDYVLQSGDVLDIKFFYNTELNEIVKIRPDGKISLQLIDEVVAAGLTPASLGSLLTRNYAKILRQPSIAVIVKDFSGQNIFVGGEVNSPGAQNLTGRITVLQSIFKAGGFKNTAAMQNVAIIRYQGTKTPLFLTVNIEDVLNNNGDDIVLRPYDIVYAPKTTIARMNEFVDQYIEKLIPITKTLGVIYNLNPTVQVK